MKKLFFTLMITVASAASLAWAQPPAATGPSTQPAAAPVQPTAAVVRWLERIQTRAEQIKTLHAKVRYDRVQGLLGDTQRRFGTLAYQAGPPARFAVHFDKLIVDQAARLQNRWYVYDGHWLAEKLVNQKVFTRRELVRPGRSRDLFELGRGPFVLPLNARKDRVLKRFYVRLVTDRADDAKTPKNSIHLELTPKPGIDIDQKRIDLWYSRKTLLPLRAATHDRSENESIITLMDVQLNKPVAAGTFDTTPPSGPGWDVRIEPLPSGSKGS